MDGNHPENFVDLTGMKFQSWTVESYSHTKNDRAYWNCKCDCGNRKVMRGDGVQKIQVPYCRECKPRNTVIQISELSKELIGRVKNREDDLFENTFIVDGSIVYGYTSNRECFIFDTVDLPAASRHTWTRKHLRDGWYVYTTVKSKFTYFHTVILDNLECEKQIDHINRDKLDNRRENLRFCSSQENCFNSAPSKANTVGFKGVYSHKSGRWHPRITFCRRVISLGLYDSKEEAASIYDAAAELLFGEFCWLNRDYIGNVPVAGGCQKKRVAEKCLARLENWQWDNNPQLLSEAIFRLKRELGQEMEVAA